MSARIPPGFAEVWMQFNTSGDPENMYCALGVDLSPGTPANAAVADVILAAATTAIRPIVTSDFTVGPGYVMFGNDGGDIRIDGSAAALAGTATGSGLPQNCAALIRKLTGLGGRRQRGRMYIPGQPEGNVVSNGQIQSSWVTTLTTQVNALKTGLEALGEVDSIVLLHDSAPFTPTVITSLEPQNRIATQRRRLRP